MTPKALADLRALDLPNRVVVTRNGAYWRDYDTPDALGNHYSMCPVSTDNDPMDIVAVYVPKAEVDRLERVDDDVAALGEAMWDTAPPRLGLPARDVAAWAKRIVAHQQPTGGQE